MKRYLWILVIPLLILCSCENRLTDNPSDRLTFSQDTISFDTVFTVAGSATKTILLYNQNKRAINIKSIRWENGQSFRINIDGEQDISNMRNLTIAGGDSIYLFIRAIIDPADRSNPLLVEDRLLFEVGDHSEQLIINAYGWDVELIDSLYIGKDTTLLGRKPYLVRNGIYIDKGALLTIQPGCRFYMQDTAKIVSYGGILAQGTLEKPILFQSHRLDDIFEGIKYAYVGGKWNGIYMFNPERSAFTHTDIVSGCVGLFVYGNNNDSISFIDSKIHNQAVYGLVLQNVNALVANSEISNCAQYCIYSAGGRHEFVHTTIASFFNYTLYAIQNTKREDAISPLYISNISKNQTKTEVYFYNSILAGVKKNCLMLATPLTDYYTGAFAYSYLQTDTLPARYAYCNVYATERDSNLFVNDIYLDKALYYNFQLDSLSPARDIADSLIATRFPLDRLGKNRFQDQHPDAGCYEYGE